MKTKLAIFDIDGTLTDSVSIHQVAFINALEKFGLFNFDTNWNNYRHHTDSYIFKAIYERQFETRIREQEIEHFENILNDFICNESTTNKFYEINGAKKFLNKLAYDYDIVFATGSLLKPAMFKLRQVGISIDESLIIASNKILSRNELVLNAIEKAKNFYSAKSYKQIISFGDGQWDYETANNLNIDFIGVGNTKLKNYGVKHFFIDFTDPTLFSLMRIKN